MEHLSSHPLGAAHLAAALAAVAVGTAVALAPKGTPNHRWLGRAYVLLMLGVNATALGIYELFGRWGAFHWMALSSLAVLVVGYVAAGRGGSRWLETHAYFMTGSYVGLLAALVAEVGSRWLPLPFAGSVILSSSVVIVTGVAVMLWRIPRALAAPTPGGDP